MKNNIVIIYSNRCNLNCKSCYIKKNLDVKSISYFDIISFIKKYYLFLGNNLNIYLSGLGEFFYSIYSNDFIKLLSEQDYISNISILTNGQILPIYNNNKIIYEVSLDYPKTFHDLNRGSGSYDKCIDFLKHLISNGSYFIIRTIISKDNVDLIHKMKNGLVSFLNYDNFDIYFNTLRKDLPYSNDFPEYYIKSNEFIIEKGFDINDTNILQEIKSYNNSIKNRKIYNCNNSFMIFLDGNVYNCAELLSKTNANIYDDVFKVYLDIHKTMTCKYQEKLDK